jgi:NAD-dependent deacetylase
MKLSPPRCTHCNGCVRPGVVWFGEDLPQDAWRQAKAWVNDCDCLLVIGTSGVVWPAAQLPIDAHGKGKLVVEVNPHVSDITRHTGIYWASTSAQALPALLAEINANGDKTS